MYSIEQWLARWPRHEPVTRPVIHIGIDGIDPDSPAHRALIQKAVKDAKEKWRSDDDDPGIGAPTHRTPR